MRLLYLNREGNLSLTEDLDKVPPYAILSHTWGSDRDEVKHADILDGTSRSKIGYAKLDFCAERARKDGIDHFWVDTCCINKNSEPELSQAIRSMFDWYQRAVKCYVFLSDVSSSKRSRAVDDNTDLTWRKSFRSSRWFTRGWTLQELLAPEVVEFYSREGVLLGSKDTLTQDIHEITGIPSAALRSKFVRTFSVEERFKWAANRETTKAEDQAYCLFGIFGVHLPILYGEGQDLALQRLRREVGVTLAQIDEVIRNRYDDGRLNVERLSGTLLPLESCYINLSIIEHAREHTTEQRDISKFSLAARLKVETSPTSKQVSLSTLFEPRQQQDGRLSRPERVLIWGRAGMGKTTLCKKIVYEVHKNRLWSDLYDRVVWLPLRRLKSVVSRDVVELLQNEFLLTGLGERVSEVLRKLFYDPRTLFLLDGVDEVSLTLASDSSAGNILRDLLSRQHVIITSRPHNARAFSYEPTDLELDTIGFSSQQVDEYIQHVAVEATMPDKTVEDIRSFIQRHPLVQSLAKIPIQLDAICFTWNMNSFPQDHMTMTVLYLKISECLWKDSIVRLGKRDSDTGEFVTKQQLDGISDFEDFVSYEINFLQELAFFGLQKEITDFSAEHIATMTMSRKIFADRRVHISFLRSSDYSARPMDHKLHFIHLTFQEFFAAQFFVQFWINGRILQISREPTSEKGPAKSTTSITPQDFLRSEKYNDRYNIFWRFVAGLLQAHHNTIYLQEFLYILENQPRDLVGLTHSRLIIHILSEMSSSDRAQELEDHCFIWMQYELNLPPNLKTNGWTLLESEADCSDKLLERFLIGDESKVKVLVALFSRASLSSCMLSKVIDILDVTHDEFIQNLTIQIIGEFCGSKQKEDFERFCQVIRRKEVKAEKVARAWEHKLLLEPAIETLVSLLHDPEAQESAVRALRWQATLPSTAIEALISLLHDPEAQESAVRALTCQDTLPGTAIEALISLLHDPEARESAADVLIEQETLPSTAIEALVSLLHVPEAQESAAKALGWQRTLPSTAIEALVSLLHVPEARESAAEALAQQETLSSTAVEALVSLLQNSNSLVRLSTVGAFSGQTTLHSTIVETLVSLLHDPSLSVQKKALSVLESLSDLPSTAIKPITLLLQGPNPLDAVSALRYVRNLPSALIEPLVSLLHHFNPLVRKNVVDILGRQTDLPDTVVETLVPLLQDPDPSVRTSVVHAIKQRKTLSSAAARTVVSQLHGSGTSITQEMMIEAVAEFEEIIVFLPTFRSKVLRCFLRNWMRTGSTHAYIWESCLWVKNRRGSYRIPVPEERLESFRYKLSKAQDNLGIPRLPFASTPP